MAKKQWYAWHDADGNGGVCKTWDECQQASSGKTGEKHKGFQTYEEAWSFAHPGEPPQPMTSAQPRVHAESETQPESAPLSGEKAEDLSVPWDDGIKSVPEYLREAMTPWGDGFTDTPESGKESSEEPEQENAEMGPDSAAVPVLDMSRADRGPVCDRVHQFCREYEYDFLSTDQRRAVQADQGKYLLFAVPLTNH